MYKSALAFGSLGVNIDKELASAGSGVYTFRIHGVVHHYIGQLTPRAGEVNLHKFTSMMVLQRESWRISSDTLEMRVSPSCDYCRTLHEVNPYVSYIRQVVDMMRDKGGVDARKIIRVDGAPDPRCYNATTAPEIAVIMPGNGYTEGVATRDIVLHARTGGLKRITETNCAYDSLHCVLLFPSGDNCWHLGIPHSRGKGCVTAIELKSYSLMVRSSLSYLHLFGRLFHQYIVDMYTKVE